ncbi:MAG: PAS domain S-box protein [Sphingomonadales bacterium]|nr:PAS domain S-box protein [Sphingomonadales bacterium]
MTHTRPFSIAMRRTYAISVGAALLLLATVGTGVYLGQETQQRFRNVSASWSTFAEQADRKGAWISEVRGHLGYGGIIHNFKNYVLRREPGYAVAVRQQLNDFYRTVDEFLEGGVSEAEGAALRSIRRTIQIYEAQLPTADRAAREGWTIGETDRLVRVDDRDAIQALAMLEETWRQSRDRARADIIRTVEEGEALIALGFRFLIGLGLVAGALLGLYYMLARQIREGFARLSTELADRLRAEQSEKKLQRAVEQSPATIVITDTSGRIEYVNRRFEELTGYSKGDVAGSTLRFLQSGETTPEQYAAIRAQLDKGREWRGVFRNRQRMGPPIGPRRPSSR